jgi:hypothetical protein
MSEPVEQCAPITVDEVIKIFKDKQNFGVLNGHWVLKDQQGRIMLGYGGKTYFSSYRFAVNNLRRLVGLCWNQEMEFLKLRYGINANYYELRNRGVNKAFDPDLILHTLLDEGIVTIEQLE